jgi:hypothetical protein
MVCLFEQRCDRQPDVTNVRLWRGFESQVKMLRPHPTSRQYARPSGQLLLSVVWSNPQIQNRLNHSMRRTAFGLRYGRDRLRIYARTPGEKGFSDEGKHCR